MSKAIPRDPTPSPFTALEPPLRPTKLPPHGLTAGRGRKATPRIPNQSVTIDPDGSDPLPSLNRILDRSRDQLQRPSGYQLKTENLTLETSIGYGYDVSGRLATLSAQGLPNLPGKSHS